MLFKDRTDAGKQLAQALLKFKGEEGVVYPLPRGGVVLGVEVARALAMPLDLIIPRKIGHPMNPEYAVCALAEEGGLVCNQHEVERLDERWLKEAVERERQEAQRRRAAYLGGRAPLPVAGKLAILVDDGIATGLTMEAAIRDMCHRQAGRIVVAIPVTPRDTQRKLAAQVDEVVALDAPAIYRGAVGAYYQHFDQVADSEVIRLLAEFV